MSNFTERSLTPEEVTEFAVCADRGMKNLRINEADSTPDSIVKQVDSFVDQWQQEQMKPRKRLFGRTPARPNSVGVALSLGAMWGNQIVQKFGWEWVCLQQDGHEFYAVTSPDRAWAIFPTYFIKACLDNPQIDCTAMLSFNMMATGNLPEEPPHSYENVMNRVHRIIPKR